ncbi:MAG: TIGR02678 family protein [Euzebya sp.]
MSDLSARGTPGVLVDVVAQRETADRRSALRALLRTPLMTAGHRDFVLVRRHSDHLREWFNEQAGWHLTVDAEHARLRKTPAGDVDHTRPATTVRTGRPLSRRRYVLWCLALAALERADSQTTLGWLAERILALSADPGLADSGLSFTLQTHPQRLDLVEAVRLLIDIGALTRVAGEEDAYLDDTGDALYDVNRRVLASVLPGVRGPSTMADLGSADRVIALTEQPLVDSSDARNRDARQRLTRRLLDDPIVYTEDLTDGEQHYLSLPGQRHTTARRVADATGLVPELRAEGVAMLDPTGDATDLTMPVQGTQGHATLLLAEHLATISTPTVMGALSRGRIHELTQEWSALNPWSKESRKVGGAQRFGDTAVEHLNALGLVSVEEDIVTARPAIMRYAVDAPTLLGAADDGDGA